MAKDRKDVYPNQRAVVYAVIYDDLRKAALDCGYALALHGSMLNDMDLLAVAWVEDAKPEEELVAALSGCTGGTIWKDHHFETREERPHGRISYNLSIYSEWRIDLSVIPPRANK